MKIGIIGGGVVGHALFRTLNEFHEVNVWDTEYVRRTATLVYVLNSDLIFICLPENLVEPWFEGLTQGTSLQCSWVIKSTVPVGTTRRIADRFKVDVVHSPEFLTARCAVVDSQMPSRNIIGDPGTFHLSNLNPSRAFSKLSALYTERFPHVPLLAMTSDESELVKLIQNAFFATKIAFWNEAHTLVQSVKGCDWQTVLNAVLMDGRIGSSHTLVPGPDGKFGFGGSCLPKDLNTFIEELNSRGLLSTIALGAQLRNVEDRKKEVQHE